MCPTGTCIINVFKALGNAIKVNRHVDTQARPCVHVCVLLIFSYLSTQNWTYIYMSSGNKWHIKNISLVPPTGTTQENRCPQTVVDRFRCRRTNSSCHHAHISAGTAPPLVRHLPAHPLHNPDISPTWLGSFRALALPFSLTSLSLRLFHSETISIGLECVELGPLWAKFEWKNF